MPGHAQTSDGSPPRTAMGAGRSRPGFPYRPHAEGGFRRGCSHPELRVTRGSERKTLRRQNRPGRRLFAQPGPQGLVTERGPMSGPRLRAPCRIVACGGPQDRLVASSHGGRAAPESRSAASPLDRRCPGHIGGSGRFIVSWQVNGPGSRRRTAKITPAAAGRLRSAGAGRTVPCRGQS